MFPIEISKQADEFDGGFLRHHFTHFHLRDGVMDISGIEDLLKEFCARHNRIVPYSVGLEDSWEIENYSYENLLLSNSGRVIYGDMYHITGNDGTRMDGDRGAVLEVDKRRISVAPLMLEGELEGLYVRQKYPHGDNCSRRLLIGDCNTLIPLPQYRGRGGSFLLPSDLGR